MNANATAKRYKRVDQREHVLMRPGMYIGSIEVDRIKTWVLDSESSERFVKKEIDYIPGLYKIFDEILVNALDQVTRLKKQKQPEVQHQVKCIKISISTEDGEISIENDGDGIDVVQHPEEENLYVPELIFGHLLTSSNYDDSEERTIGGQNGIGAKACNIFSKRFRIETIDARLGKKYTQTFRDNMSVREAPKITACASKKPYTKISFVPDYARFNSSNGLSEDMRALFMRRCYDLCALTDKDVSVTVNGKKLSIKSFEKYAELYFPVDEHRKIAHEVIETNLGAWEVAATFSDTQAFEHVSFVNGVSTLKGGRHVDYFSAMIVKELSEAIAKKRKDVDVKQAMVKNHMFVFVKATIGNPVFDGQSKETLTTPSSKFGTGKLVLSERFYTSLTKTGIVDKILELTSAAQMKDLKKLDGKVSQRITGIVKLDDANWAGGPRRKDCTLILTEGDSAKSMALAGISVVGKNAYGVYPLRGKVLNVKEVTLKKLMENEEINHIRTIMGLETGKKYTTSGELRYGRIMIMTDQDADGSHIKGLLFNLFETLWPELLRIKGFLTSMLTPIIKISKGKSPAQAFYTIQEYDAWKHSMGPALAKAFSVKYYKGLGTSTSAEAKEYFKDPKIVTYSCADEVCAEALNMAFNPKRADDRKRWLGNYDKEAVLSYGGDTNVRFDEFINKDLIHYCKYDNDRSIPSVVDGLKTSQRKIMFTCFGRSWSKEIKVFMLSAEVAGTAAYHHGDTSLNETIIGLAQDYVGKNNVNLLDPVGQFGTRRMNGHDAASPRYICTRPMPIVDLIFRPEDKPVLTYLEDDGQMVEPEFYVPIIPMVLVNGAAGIGFGFSTNVPCFNPLEIVRAIKDKDFARFDLMKPWYRGFKGSILKLEKSTENAKEGGRYVTRGIYERKGPKTVHVTELPIGFWTDDFKKLLEAKIADSSLMRYDVQYTDSDSFEFVLTFRSEAELDAISSKFAEEYKLSSMTSAMTNMHLFNHMSQITKYKSIRDVAEAYANVRLVYYTKRKNYMVKKLQEENTVLENKARFIEEIVSNKLVIGRRSIEQVNADLAARKFVKVDDSWRYLLEMHIMSLTLERKAKLDAEIAANVESIKYYRDTPEHVIWNKELSELEAALSKSNVYA